MAIIIDWAEDQFRQLGRRDARDLAVRAFAAHPGCRAPRKHLPRPHHPHPPGTPPRTLRSTRSHARSATDLMPSCVRKELSLSTSDQSVLALLALPPFRSASFRRGRGIRGSEHLGDRLGSLSDVEPGVDQVVDRSRRAPPRGEQPSLRCPARGRSVVGMCGLESLEDDCPEPPDACFVQRRNAGSRVALTIASARIVAPGVRCPLCSIHSRSL